MDNNYYVNCFKDRRKINKILTKERKKLDKIQKIVKELEFKLHCSQNVNEVYNGVAMLVLEDYVRAASGNNHFFARVWENCNKKGSWRAELMTGINKHFAFVFDLTKSEILKIAKNHVADGENYAECKSE